MLYVYVDIVVASAGEDRKISLWMKNGQNLGSISHSGSDTGDNINVSANDFPESLHSLMNALGSFLLYLTT